MEYIVLLVIIFVMYFILKYILECNMTKIRNEAENNKLNEITKKYPSNIEICKDFLKKLNNINVKIVEDKDANSTLYLVTSNKIFIANLKESYTRIQTIAHECLHSIQSKKILWFNFIFSNIYIAYFLIICVLAILKILPYKTMFLSILIILGFVFYVVRSYLEDDAMIKARYLANDYMHEKNISSEEEIDKIIKKYDELNNMGIKAINFQLLSNVFLKVIVLLIIFILF